MRNAVKQVAIAVAVMLGLALALFAASRWRGAPPAHRQALAIMQAPSVMPGENAFAALWLLRYDVPAERQAEVAAEDARRFGRAPPPSDAQHRPFQTAAAARFDDLQAARESDPPPCDDGCLSRVREDADVYAGWTARQVRLAERVSALSGYGYYRSGFTPRVDMPFPDLGAVSRVRTMHALAFVQGRHDEALDGVCRDARTWRRLVPNSDSLIVSMAGVGFYDRSLRLFADMLAELPPGHPLPASCRIAFAAPAVLESSICAAMKGEFGFGQAAMRQVADDRRAWLFFDREMTAAQMAHGMVRACDPSIGTRPDARQGGTQPWWAALVRFECVSNFIGCVLGDIAAPAYGHYLLRAEDHATRMQAGTALLRLHEGQGGTLHEPQGLLRFGARTLEFELGDRGRQTFQQLPLPSSRAGPQAEATGTDANAPAATARAAMR